MRKFVLLCSTAFLGLVSANPASAGFVAGNANTSVVQIRSGFSYNNANGLVNKFTPATPTIGPGQMVTTAGNYLVPNNPVGTFNTYSQSLKSSKMNVYLVVARNSTTFLANATNGETVVGVAASNGNKGWYGGSAAMERNVVGSHSSLQADVAAALYTVQALNPQATNAAAAFFGTGNAGIEIQGNVGTNVLDTYFKSWSSVTGTVTNSNFDNSQFGELSLVFTVVPEPSSVGLFGIGAVAFGFVRSRRKKS